MQCFLQPPALEVFVRRKGLEATIKLSFKVVGKCSQRWVEIFKTYCFDAKSPDHCKFRCSKAIQLCVGDDGRCLVLGLDY